MTQTTLFTKLTVAPNVTRALHLVSIDERREPFTPTLTNHDSSRIDEVWFAGGHADVGGGHAERRLADVTLRFMIDHATEHGLRLAEDALDEVPANALFLGRLHSNQESLLATSPRCVGVKRAGRWARTLKPQIHSSVLRRMDCLGDRYQPENVLAYSEASRPPFRGKPTTLPWKRPRPPWGERGRAALRPFTPEPMERRRRWSTCVGMGGRLRRNTHPGRSSSFRDLSLQHNGAPEGRQHLARGASPGWAIRKIP